MSTYVYTVYSRWFQYTYVRLLELLEGKNATVLIKLDSFFSSSKYSIDHRGVCTDVTNTILHTIYD